MSKPKTKTPSNKTPGKTANKSRMLRVGIVQQPCTDDRDYNLQMSEDGLRAAAAGGAQLVLLQELPTSLYFCQHEATELFALAETLPGPSTDFLAELAQELGSSDAPCVGKECVSTCRSLGSQDSLKKKQSHVIMNHDK